MWFVVPFEGVVKPQAALSLAREKQMHKVVEALALPSAHQAHIEQVHARKYKIKIGSQAVYKAHGRREIGFAQDKTELNEAINP
jgi:hypothetical protein